MNAIQIRGVLDNIVSAVAQLAHDLLKRSREQIDITERDAILARWWTGQGDPNNPASTVLGTRAAEARRDMQTAVPHGRRTRARPLPPAVKSGRSLIGGHPEAQHAQATGSTIDNELHPRNLRRHDHDSYGRKSPIRAMM
jgi:hypothetical protein